MKQVIPIIFILFANLWPQLLIDDFNDTTGLGDRSLLINDLGESISKSANGNMNHTGAGNLYFDYCDGNACYFRTELNTNISSFGDLVLTIRRGGLPADAADIDLILNDGSDNTVNLSAYGTITTSDQDFTIPLADFGATLSSAAHLQLDMQNTSGCDGIIISEIKVSGTGGPVAPVVNSTTPADNGTINTNSSAVIINFSENMDSAAVLTAASIDNGLSFTSADGDGTASITLNLDNNPADVVTYTVTVSTNAQSDAGLHMAAPYTFSFTGTNIPLAPVRVLSTVPADNGNLNLDQSNITITFDTNMNGLNVASNCQISGLGVSGLSYAGGSGTSSITLTINGTLFAGESYSVTVNSNAQSTDGAKMLSNYVFNFTAVDQIFYDLTLAVSNTDTGAAYSGTAAIQNAMDGADEGNTLHVYPGTYDAVSYNGTGPADQANSGLKVIAVSFILSNNNRTAVVSGGLNTFHIYYTHSIELHGLTIQNATANGVLYENINSNSVVANCCFLNCNIGIDVDFEEADHCSFYSNLVSNSTQSGIRAINADQALIWRNLIVDSGGDGILIGSAVTGCEVYHNTAVNNAGNGLYVTGGSHTVINNIFSGNGDGAPSAEYGINLAGGSLNEKYNLFYDNNNGNVSGFTASGTDYNSDSFLDPNDLYKPTNGQAIDNATNLALYSQPWADSGPDIGYIESGIVPSRPTVTVNQNPAQLDPTNAVPVVFDILFSTNVTGLTPSDIQFIGTATVTSWEIVTNTAADYTLNVTGISVDGTIVPYLDENIAQSPSGKGNQTCTWTDNSVTFSSAHPEVYISTGPTNSLTTNQSFNVELTTSDDWGYWSTNGASYVQFSNGTSGTINISGTTSLSYYGEDSSANNSGTNTVTYTFDTIAPGVSITTGPASDITTNEAFNIELTTTDDWGYWSTNGASYVQFSNGTSGTINISGTTSLSYYGEDSLGNNSTTNSVTYTFNTAAPVVSITSGPTSDITTNQSFNIELTTTDDWGYWSTNGASYVQFSNGSSGSISISGTTSLSYYGEDSLGNNSTTNSVTYTFDTNAPTVTVLNGLSNSIVTNNSFFVNLSADEDFGYYDINGNGWNSFSGTAAALINGDLASNAVTMRYYGEDSLGNNSTTNSVTYYIIYDPPRVSLNQPANEQLLYNEVTFSGTVTDPVRSIDQVTLYFTNQTSGTNFTATASLNGTNWSYTLNTRQYANGSNYSVYAVAQNDVDLYACSSSNTFMINNLDLQLLAGPNPFIKKDSSLNKLRIKGLGWESKVKIYTVNGFLVKSFTDMRTEFFKTGNQPGIIHWDLCNQNNQPVSSGIYLIKVRDKVNGINKMIRLSILR